VGALFTVLFLPAEEKQVTGIHADELLYPEAGNLGKVTLKKIVTKKTSLKGRRGGGSRAGLEVPEMDEIWAFLGQQGEK